MQGSEIWFQSEVEERSQSFLCSFEVCKNKIVILLIDLSSSASLLFSWFFILRELLLTSMSSWMLIKFYSAITTTTSSSKTSLNINSSSHTTLSRPSDWIKKLTYVSHCTTIINSGINFIIYRYKQRWSKNLKISVLVLLEIHFVGNSSGC